MKYSICFEGETMGTASGSFTVTVAPATTTLTMNPTINTFNEKEGVADPGQKVCDVSGGTPPYTFTATGVPDGMDLKQVANADSSVTVLLEGTPSAGDAALSPYAMDITATDSATPAAQARISIRR